ncbi:MAG: hypothetical protein PGN25_05880 [Methylorubrum populi]
MTTCAAAIIAIAAGSALIIVGLMAFAIRRVWRAADEMKQQMDEERDSFEKRRARLRRGLAGPSLSFGRGRAA